MSVTSVDNSVSSTVSTTTSSISQELDKYDFLKILAAELQNQDPTDPMDNKDFIAQLASFSTLEQIQNMASSFDAMGESLQSYMVTQAASLIGKNAVAELEGSEIEGTIDSIFIQDSTPYAMIDSQSVPVSSITRIYEAEVQTAG